ncbi:MAG: PKD domain-containing protein [Bacteroidales bacterium]|nr:PKD domain-containing protein [Bacteroidales bacterium]
MRLSTFVSIVLLCTVTIGFSQTDNTFWFGAPDVSSDHGNTPKNGAPLNLHITAVYATHVTISRPADPGFTPIEFDLTELEHRTVRLDNYPGLAIDKIETYPMPDLATGMQDKGFLIEAYPGEVTAYYEMDNEFNRDIFPLKGRNALGKDFWVSTQNYFPNGNYSGTAFSGFVIVATEDNTVVTVDQNAAWYYFPTVEPRTVVLNRGQTFAFRATGTISSVHINGVHVTSNKDIAITVYDDSVKKKNIVNGACTANLSYDIVGDQTIPVDIIGKEYIVMKGEIVHSTACDDGELVFFYSTELNTSVSINGVPYTTLTNPGDMEYYPLVNNATYISADKPIYVFHTSGFGGELGGAILPSIDNCTGSHDVTITRTPNSNDKFFVKLMVRNDLDPGSEWYYDAINNFTMTVGGIVYPIPSTYFEYIMGDQFAVLKDIPEVDAFFGDNVAPGQVVQISNPAARFHLGMINGATSTGCKYGYFSDYAASGASAGLGGALSVTQEVYCNLDPIHLVASGGHRYSWECISHPYATSLITDTAYSAPYFFPDTTGDFVFKVTVFGECSSDQEILMLTRVRIGPTSDFTLSENIGCSPFTVTVSNTTDTIHAEDMIWVIDKPYQEIDQDTIPLVFNHSFPNNFTDTIQTYKLSLYSYSADHNCRSVREKVVKVKPELNAAFSVDTTMGCHPLDAIFTNESTGHLDSTSYSWDFGDNSQSFLFEPDHTFENYSRADTTFTVRLITESPLGCIDSASLDLTIHPRVRAVMAINTSASCSPMEIYIDPSNSIGVDTFFWNIGYPPGLDSTYLSLTKDSIRLYHQDLTYAGPDTLYVNMVGMNRMGCVDTFPQRNIIVFPEVNAEFLIANDSICDADSITFLNNSQGYELFYNWDFNDGTVYQDTLGSDFTHPFYNRSDADSVYHVTLTATSGFFCESIFDTFILVHPYVKANFGMDYENNCTPILTDITNLSVRGHNFEWDFGDGTTSTTADPSFTHQFWNNSATSDTTYYISLIASNNEGCADTLTRELDIFPHVIAAFNMSDSVGCSPLNVAFTNNSSGGLLSYLWNFGNGTTSTNPAPIPRNYSNLTDTDTLYFISLTAINPYGCDSMIMDTVEVFARIDADFNLPQSDSCSPFILHPENLSSPGANFYTWELINSGLMPDNNFTPDFGTLTNVSLETDTLYLRLTATGATDPEHLACADRDSIRVLVYPELDVDFALDVHESCQPLYSTITNNSNIIPGSYFEWYIDSTYYSAHSSPSPLEIDNLESTDSEHVIYLSGESKFGCSGEHYDTITVYSLVDARFTINKAGICSADSFQIDRRTSRGGIVSYEWDFDGVIDGRSDSMFYYSFENIASPTPLTQNIKLTVANSHFCEDTISKNIIVYPEVRAAFSVDDSTVCYPYETQFANTTENAGFYFWDFGDGTGSNDFLPENYVFNNFDKLADTTYYIKLIARSPYNCYDSTDHQITVFAKPEAEFYFPVLVDCPPFNASMANESQGLGLTYLWSFNDGSTSTAFEPTHTFENITSTVLNSPVRLIATSSRTCADTITHSLSIYPNVEVSFSFEPQTGCSPLYVDFDGAASNVNSRLWYVDGVPFSTLEDASREFVNNTPATKDYTVRFEANSIYGCSDDTVQIVRVYSSPTAEFIPNPLNQFYGTALDQTTVTFNNQTYFRPDWLYSWDFGDGNASSSIDQLVEHIYGAYFWGPNSNENKIPVSLVAWNKEMEECRDSVTYNITIKPPLPEIALEEDVASCVPYTIDFSATVKYAEEDSYAWDFGEDGAISNEDAPSYTYTEPGTYTVVLTVAGEGGANWDSRIITVYPKPNVDFTFNDSAVYVHSQNRPNEIINFYNKSTLAENYWWFFELPGSDIISMSSEMNFAAANSTEKDPTWYFEETGLYYVGLIAESPHTCLDTFIHPVGITVMGEGRIQFPNGFFVNPNDGPPSSYIDDPESPRRNIFRAYGQGVAEFRLSVYNRWGVLVFETDDINSGWNGYIDGGIAKQDVYVWRARGSFTNGEPFEMNGDVTLIHTTDPTQLYDR